MKKLHIFFALFISLSFSAQKENRWLKLKRFEVAVLSDSLQENSGLNFFGPQLLIFNDSGNSSEIFQLEKNSGKIKNIFKTNLKNIDWEAVTSDSTAIYMGDFGNNAGTRKDLKIYKIPLRDVQSGQNASNVHEIPFHYPEQIDFTAKNLNNNFDAEAMVFLNGKIHIFTKEWQAKSTTHYIVDPNISENQAAKKTETFYTGFMVTDASYFDKKLYLVGYTKKTEVFLCIFNETKPGLFFQYNPVKYYLGSALNIGQIEGVAVDRTGIYISGEAFVTPLGKAKQQLYHIPFQKLK